MSLDAIMQLGVARRIVKDSCCLQPLWLSPQIQQQSHSRWSILQPPPAHADAGDVVTASRTAATMAAFRKVFIAKNPVGLHFPWNVRFKGVFDASEKGRPRVLK